MHWTTWRHIILKHNSLPTLCQIVASYTSVIGAVPPIILRNSEKTHSKLSAGSSCTSTLANTTFWKWLLTPTNTPQACRTNWPCMWCRMLWLRWKMCTATCCSRLPTSGSWSCPRCQPELCTPIWSVDPLPQFLQKSPSSSSHHHLPTLCLSFRTDFSQIPLDEWHIFHRSKKSAYDVINLRKVDIVLPQLLYQVSTLHITVLVRWPVYRLAKVWQGEWLWLSRCSAIYHILSSIRSNLMSAGHSQRQDCMFSTPGLHCTGNQSDQNAHTTDNLHLFVLLNIILLRNIPLLTEQLQTISCMHFVLSTFSRLLPYLIRKPFSQEYKF